MLKFSEKNNFYYHELLKLAFINYKQSQMKRKNIILGLLFLMFLGISEEAFSQRKASRSSRSTRSSDRQEEKVS